MELSMSLEMTTQLHSGRGGAEKRAGGAKNNAKPAANPGLTFQRREFFKNPAPEKRKWLIKKELVEDIKIPESTIREYRIFLRDHYARLHRLSEDPENADILRSPRHKYDKLLLDSLRGERGLIDEGKLQQFLSQPRGWEIAAMLLEHQLALQEMAYGIVTEREFPRSVKDRNPKEAIEHQRRFFSREPGETVSEYRHWKFEAIKADATEIQYMKAMTGVDIDDYVIEKGIIRRWRKPLKLDSGRPAESKTMPESMRAEMQRFREARMLFFHDGLGIPKHVLDASAEEWLLRDHPQLDGLWMHDRLQQVLGPRSGDPRTDTIALMRAREITLGEMLERYLIKDLKLAPEVQITQEKIKAVENIRDNAAGLKTAREQEITKQQEVLRSDKGTAESAQTALNSEQAKITELAVLREKTSTEFAGATTVTDLETQATTLEQSIDDGAMPPGAATIRGRRMQAELDKQTYISTHPDSLGPQFKAKAVADYAEAELQLKMTRLQEAETKIGEQIKARRDRVTELRAGQDDLKDAGEIGRNADAASTQIDNDFLRTKRISFTHGGTTYEVTDADLYDVHNPKSIDDVMQKVNEVYDAQVAAGVASPLGWAKEANGRPENRAQIVRAMANARVLTLEPSLGAQLVVGHELGFLTSSAHCGFTEGQIIRLPTNEIVTRMNALHAEDTRVGRTPPRGWAAADNPTHTADIDTIAKPLAQKRLDARAHGLQGVQEDVDARITQLEEDKALIDYSSDSEKAKQVLTMVARKDNIFESAQEIVRNKNEYTYSQPAIGSRDVVITDAEKKDFDIRLGYLKIMEDWFGYQIPKEAVKTRTQRFEEVYAFMPPQKFAELMNRHLDLGLGVLGRHALNINNVLVEMRDQIGTTIHAQMIRDAQKGIIEELLDETIAGVK